MNDEYTDDERLQVEVSNGNINDDNPDARLYRVVFKALSQRPNDRLAPDFAGRVVHRLQHRVEASSRQAFLWMWAGIFVMAVVAGVAMLFVESLPETKFFRLVNNHWWSLLSLLLVFIVVQLLDNRLIKKPAAEQLLAGVK